MLRHLSTVEGGAVGSGHVLSGTALPRRRRRDLRDRAARDGRAGPRAAGRRRPLPRHRRQHRRRLRPLPLGDDRPAQRPRTALPPDDHRVVLRPGRHRPALRRQGVGRRHPGRLPLRAAGRDPRVPQRVRGAGLDAAAVHAGGAAGGVLRGAGRAGRLRAPAQPGGDDRVPAPARPVHGLTARAGPRRRALPGEYRPAQRGSFGPMQAIVYTSNGDPDVLELVERDTPEPGPGEVRVRVAYSGINPTDWKARRARPLGPAGFQIPDQDGSGVVDAVGNGVDPAVLGQRVWLWEAAQGRPWGTAAEYTVLPQRQAVL